jgi:hypothetical protein
MELIDLVEQSVVSDLLQDSLLASYNPRKRDDAFLIEGDATSDPPPYTITVTAEDRGDHRQIPGAGLKLIGLEVEITCNLLAAQNTTLMGELAGRVDDRLPAFSIDTPEAEDVLNRLSNYRVKVAQINADTVEKGFHRDLARTRVITREFVCLRTGIG